MGIEALSYIERFFEDADPARTTSILPVCDAAVGGMIAWTLGSFFRADNVQLVITDVDRKDTPYIKNVTGGSFCGYNL